ncbi:hypothetical protein ABLW17_09550 [Anaerococcus murdochii]|uniref:hypothetical protein n=1 Tax=Anaerococcus murdochii TaxID=411577 RepID=UPI00280AA941|nr:hypothetical protein [uncultured Anaerococcus sp.]
MDRLKELKEAKEAADQVIIRIDAGLNQLKSASSWGILDIFGGGLFSSLVKRNKIGEANRSLDELSLSLKSLNKELSDVDISLPDAIPDSLSDELFDLVFDNIFTDIRVQGEIKENLIALKELRHAVVEIRDKVDRQIRELEA